MNKPKPRWKLLTIVSVAILTLLVVYELLFGKLFPYSPVIIGFEKHELEHTIVYVETGAPDSGYEHFDSLIPAIEDFHDLSFAKKARMFLFADSSSYIRHSQTRARFCVYYNSRLFVSPWAVDEAERGEISMETYLTHELSHSLLHQHSGMFRAARYPKWLLEGIAVYSSNQMGTSFYPGREETIRLMQAGNFIDPRAFKTRAEDDVELNVGNRIPFMYSEFACIVEYLIAEHGREKFLTYMKSLLSDSNNEKIFRQVYGIGIDEFLGDFMEWIETK